VFYTSTGVIGLEQQEAPLVRGERRTIALQNVTPRLVMGVIGVGTVGSAVYSFFKRRGMNVVCYDKFTYAGSVAEVNQADAVFVCVPTPYVAGRGLDVSAVDEAVSLLDGEKCVVLKSTVPPGTTDRLQREYGQHRFFFNPEFLREKSAEQDFLLPDRQLMGYCRGEHDMAERLLGLLPRAPYECALPATSAELIKLLTNSFLALKVSFANEVYDLTRALGIDYEEVREGVAADPRVGGSHLHVLDGGYRGYGGKCLPKDVAGLVDFSRGFGSPMSLLETSEEINQRLALGSTSESPLLALTSPLG
jgi:UDPglucose 6-dehydrogenase